MKLYLLATAALLTITTGAASAATVTFEGQAGNPYSEAGLLFSDFGINNSANCPVGDDKCAQVGGTASVTTDPIGGLFSLSSLLLNLVGAQATLTLTAGTITQTFSSDGLIDLSAFQNVSMVFFDVNKGNAFIDDVSGTVAPIPVPAAGLLLLSALGGLAFLRRKQV
jgi:hypothetical protein